MHDITLQSVSVIADGGSHEGRLVFADNHLVAVVAQVSAQETAGGRQAGGWFLEAGFGPCGSLMTAQQPIFASLDEAVEWVRWKLDAKLSS